MLARIASLLVVALVLGGCATNPETGRSQVILVSAQDEARMGLESFSKIKQAEKISDNPMAIDRVNEVGRRIVSAIGREVPHAEWEFVVFESEALNAFALPGGKVGIYTGILELTTTDDELAAIMGHEIAHVTLRHSGERVTQNMAVAGLALGTEIYMESEDMDSADRMLTRAGIGAGSALFFTLPFSRTHETEADIVGLRYAAGAGYDPRAAITFWEKMKIASEMEGRPPEFLSTHPSPDNRIARLAEMAPQLLPLYRKRKAEFEARAMNPMADREIGAP